MISAVARSDGDKASLEQNIGLMLVEIQTRFYSEVDLRKAFDDLLKYVLELTDSEYGFIGEVRHDSDGSAYLKTFAITNVAWDDETRRFFEENAPNGLEFRNPETLFGHVLTSGRAVVSNAPKDDPRAAGTPHGHPPLNAFLGLPFHVGAELVGMLGIANRPGGYDDQLIESLGPLTRSCAFVIRARDQERRRIRAEAELRERDLHHQRIIETLPDAIYVQVDGEIVFSNRRAVEMFRAGSADRLVGTPARTLYNTEVRDQFERRIEEISTRGDDQVFCEFTCLRLDGETFDGEAAGNPIIWMGESAVLVVVRDITKRKEAERERALLEGQLRQPQKMESLGTLAGGIAHELNNMLLPITGLTELAMRELETDTRTHKNLDAVRQSARRAALLVDKILSFSHPDDAQRDLVDLRSIVAEEMELFAATLPATVQVCVELGDDVVTVLADETQLHQVLMNLASNAVHAMGGKVGVMTIRLSADELFESAVCSRLRVPPGRYAKLAVEDTGHGMSHETADRIFDPFFTTKCVGEGTGMGLAMVHGIVKAHGGAIEVSSELDGGTTFEIYLPIAAGRTLAAVA